jgi:hypothetical protein
MPVHDQMVAKLQQIKALGSSCGCDCVRCAQKIRTNGRCDCDGCAKRALAAALPRQ